MNAIKMALAVAVMGLGSFATDAFGEVARGSRVMIIPFNTLNLPADQQWIAKAMQDTLMADVGKDYTAVAFEGQTIVEDNPTAARVAREASAPNVIRGSAQVVNGEVRLTAQLIDSKTGATVTTAIATGPVNNLFKVEDEVLAQLRGVQTQQPGQATATQPLPPAYSSQQVTTFKTPTTTYRVHEPYPPQPFNDISLSAQNYNDTAVPAYTPAYYPDYGYTPAYYSAPYYPSYYPSYYSGYGYGYGYPFGIGLGLGFYYGGWGHDHHDHHDHGGHGGHGHGGHWNNNGNWNHGGNWNNNGNWNHNNWNNGGTWNKGGGWAGGSNNWNNLGNLNRGRGDWIQPTTGAGRTVNGFVPATARGGFNTLPSLNSTRGFGAVPNINTTRGFGTPNLNTTRGFGTVPNTTRGFGTVPSVNSRGFNTVPAVHTRAFSGYSGVNASRSFGGMNVAAPRGFSGGSVAAPRMSGFSGGSRGGFSGMSAGGSRGGGFGGFSGGGRGGGGGGRR